MKTLPFARKNNLIEQELKNEILVYDLNINKAFCLNQTAAIVFQACDGKTTFSELKAKINLSDEVILLALDSLQKENLLQSKADFLTDFGGLSRRQIIKKIGFASMVVLPVVASLVAPKAAHSQSIDTPIADLCSPAFGRPNDCPCSRGNQCATRSCVGGVCATTLPPPATCSSPTGKPDGCACSSASDCSSGVCEIPPHLPCPVGNQCFYVAVCT